MYVCCIGMLRDLGREGEEAWTAICCTWKSMVMFMDIFPWPQGTKKASVGAGFSPFPCQTAAESSRRVGLTRQPSSPLSNSRAGAEWHMPAGGQGLRAPFPAPALYDLSLSVSLLPLYMAPRTRYDDCSRAFFYSIICRIINYSAGEIISTAPSYPVSGTFGPSSPHSAISKDGMQYKQKIK